MRAISRDHSVPIELAARLRSFFNETNRWRYYDSQSQELLKEMTAKLRGEPPPTLAPSSLTQPAPTAPPALPLGVCSHTLAHPRP